MWASRSSSCGRFASCSNCCRGLQHGMQAKSDRGHFCRLLGLSRALCVTSLAFCAVCTVYQRKRIGEPTDDYGKFQVTIMLSLNCGSLHGTWNGFQHRISMNNCSLMCGAFTRSQLISCLSKSSTMAGQHEWYSRICLVRKIGNSVSSSLTTCSMRAGSIPQAWE